MAVFSFWRRPALAVLDAEVPSSPQRCASWNRWLHYRYNVRISIEDLVLWGVHDGHPHYIPCIFWRWSSNIEFRRALWSCNDLNDRSIVSWYVFPAGQQLDCYSRAAVVMVVLSKFARVATTVPIFGVLHVMGYRWPRQVILACFYMYYVLNIMLLNSVRFLECSLSL